MLRLGGALCTFGLDTHPRTLLAMITKFGSLFSRAGRTHPPAAGSSCALAGHHHSAQAGQPLFLRGADQRSTVLRSIPWLLRIDAAIGEADLDDSDPAIGESLFRQVCARTRKASRTRAHADPRSDTPSHDFCKTGVPVFFHQPNRAVLGTSYADQVGGSLRTRGAAITGAGAHCNSSTPEAFLCQRKFHR